MSDDSRKLREMSGCSNAAFLFVVFVTVASLSAIKATGFYEDTNRLGGWSVGIFTGLFFGGYVVWSAGWLARRP